MRPNPKLDPGLHRHLRELEEAPGHDPGLAARRVSVWVRFEGDIDPARQAGLQVELVAGDVAAGTVAVTDLERVADADGVVSLRETETNRPQIKDSVPAIHADHSTISPLGLTGAGVIVGIVDSGIDVFHQNFVKDDGTTRLLSLLDQTLRQTITLTGGPTGGSFTLAWEGPSDTPAPSPVPTSGAIPFNATAAQVQAALVGLPGGIVTAADIAVGGGPLPGTGVTVDFVGRYLNRDMTLLTSPTPNALTGGASPAVQVARGRVFSAAEINAALGNPAAGFPSTDPSSANDPGHGTHVAGIAAGDGSQAGNCHGSGVWLGVAPAADLIVVKTTFNSKDVVAGVGYVFAQATTLAKPAVVNLSLGRGSGPHDGTSEDELAINALLADNTGAATPGRAVVISSGNSGRITDPALPGFGGEIGLHARAHIPANGNVTWTVVVPPGDLKADSIDIWYEGAARLTVQLTPPPGFNAGPAVAAPAAPSPPNFNRTDLASQTAGQIAACTARIWSYITRPPVAWPYPVSHPRAKNEIFLELDPPPPLAPPPAASPPPQNPIAAGPWTITLTETAGTATDVDAWISASEKDPYPQFLPTDQDRSRTVGAPGTAANAITVASYDYRDGTLADSSSRGPWLDTDNRPNMPRKPDLTAPGVKIVSAKNKVRDPGCWCDCCYDFYVDLSGTSMAAPHVTGVVALMLERNKHLGFDQIKALLTGNCQPPTGQTGPLPNDDWGAGVVDAKQALDHTVAQALAGGEPPRLHPVRLPAAATWPATIPTAERLRALRARLGDDPAAMLTASLVSTHVDEVLRLINTNRRVAVLWHRMDGPELLRAAMRFADGRPLELPLDPNGRTLVEWLERMLPLLARYGSPELQRDVARHGPFVLDLARSVLDAPEQRRLAG